MAGFFIRKYITVKIWKKGWQTYQRRGGDLATLFWQQEVKIVTIGDCKKSAENKIRRIFTRAMPEESTYDNSK